MKVKTISAILLALFIASCTKKSPNIFTSSPELIHIHNLADKKKTDSLIYYLQSTDTVLQARAAYVLASVQDTLAIPTLQKVWDAEQSIIELRKNAAFALGQIPGSANALLYAYQKESNNQVKSFLIEAMGKTFPATSFESIYKMDDSDSIIAIGKAYALYNIVTRNLADSLTIRQTYQLLRHPSNQTKLIAAHALARARNIKLRDDKNYLAQLVQHKNPEIRMAVALAFRNVTSEESFNHLKSLGKDKDYRVRINALRAMRNQTTDKKTEPLLLALRDTNKQVQVAAAEVLLAMHSPQLLDSVLQHAEKAKHFRTQALLYQTAMATRPDAKTILSIKKIYKASFNPYQKAMLLAALAYTSSEHKFLAREIMFSYENPVQIAAAQALVETHYLVDFPDSLKQLYAIYFKDFATKKDVPLMSIVGSAIADTTLGYKTIIKDYSFLKSILKEAKLPRDNESLQSIQQALAYLEGKLYQTPKNPYSHPIMWDLVKALPGVQQATVFTNKGKFKIELYTNEAPGSVGNFVDLALKLYFDDKVIHRVVPNFVAQTGCNRGDGFGSEDYAIRSEFTHRRYQTGAIGMASAGKDTEGTQWFVTHSPTPHLEGKYSVFGKVIEGQDIVDQLEMGDYIIRVRLH
ncbi:MAG: peptidylprolyl isomerase [Cyclobacteriaceae bacterium]|jgi:cyclophilin family peptidyl-prolyl cis-trans isomerase/HEAT repeat protein|nr:peptidylprolyl isomerase [Cyclobacteriaceae bacterium]